MLGVLSCPTLWDPMDCRPPGSSVHGILQVRMLEWLSLPFSKVSSQTRAQTADSYNMCHHDLMSHRERYLNYYEGIHIPWWLKGKESICLHCRRHRRHRFDPWVGKIPWRSTWQPIWVFLPGETQGQRSLASYSPQGHRESDMTEAT